jgi:hypothetical protein
LNGDEVPAVVTAAGRDLVAYLRTDLAASGFEEFVETYFKNLKAEPIGDDLKIENSLGEVLILRRDETKGHRGYSSLRGSNNFRLSADLRLLNVDGGIKRDPKGLIDHLARFNREAETGAEQKD